VKELLEIISRKAKFRETGFVIPRRGVSKRLDVGEIKKFSFGSLNLL